MNTRQQATVLAKTTHNILNGDDKQGAHPRPWHDANYTFYHAPSCRHPVRRSHSNGKQEETSDLESEAAYRQHTVKRVN